jgi:Tfp pilus assembly protein PilE
MGTSKDHQYSFSVSTTGDGQSFTLTATPVSGGNQQGDGNLSINQSGQRLWGSSSW